MKLITKLLPLSFVAASTAAVSPFVASCNSSLPEPGGEIIVYDSVKTEDIFKGKYTRSTPQLGPQFFADVPTAFDRYLDETSFDGQIYKDDVFLSAQTELKSWLDGRKEHASWDLDEFVGTVDFGISSVHKEEKRVSYGIKLNTTVVAKLKEEQDIQIKFKVNVNVEARNIKFDLEYQPETPTSGQWWCHSNYVTWKSLEDTPQLNISALKDDKRWSVKLDAGINVIDSDIPGIKGNITMNGSYNHESGDDESSCFWLEMIFSELWHKVDYLSKTYISKP